MALAIFTDSGELVIELGAEVAEPKEPLALLDAGDYRTETCYCHAGDPAGHTHKARIPIGMPQYAWQDILDHKVAAAKVAYANSVARKIASWVESARRGTVMGFRGTRLVRAVVGPKGDCSLDDLLDFIREDTTIKQRIGLMAVHPALVEHTYKLARRMVGA